MSRFAAIDLTTLPSPTAVVELDFDAILSARLQELEAQLTEVFEPTKVVEVMALARNIAASPMRYLNEAAAARELYMSNQINAAIRSVFLSTAQGADLDHIGASRGVARKVMDASDPEDLLMETDEVFRARIQLVMESYSPHGTEGSYVYWALDADDRVADVAVYGPNHGLDPPIAPAEPKMVVLSSEGDGAADPDLLAAVMANCTSDKRRPVADKLTVISATPVDPDAVEPDQINGGTFNTIEAAIDASGNGAIVRLELLAGKTYAIDTDIQAGHRSIIVVGQDALNRSIVRPAMTVSETLNIMKGFRGSPGWELHFQNIDFVYPSKLDDALPLSTYISLLRYSPACQVAVGIRDCSFTGQDGQSIVRANNAIASTVRLSNVTLDGDIVAVSGLSQSTLVLAQYGTTLLNGAALTNAGAIGIQILQN